MFGKKDMFGIITTALLLLVVEVEPGAEMLSYINLDQINFIPTSTSFKSVQLPFPIVFFNRAFNIINVSYAGKFRIYAEKCLTHGLSFSVQRYECKHSAKIQNCINFIIIIKTEICGYVFANYALLCSSEYSCCCFLSIFSLQLYSAI